MKPSFSTLRFYTFCVCYYWAAQDGANHPNGALTMPPTGNEWLALTPEPALEADLPICDPHHHFWVQRPEPLDYQQYLLPDLAADITSGHNVRSTVFVEARSSYRTDGPEEMRPVGEVEFVQAIADASATGDYGPGRAAAGIIGRTDLKLGDRCAAGARSSPSRQSQPVPRHPALGRVGPPSRCRKPRGGRLSLQGRLPGWRTSSGRHGACLGKLPLFPPDGRLGRFRQANAEPDHRPQSHRRNDAHRPLRRGGTTRSCPNGARASTLAENVPTS